MQELVLKELAENGLTQRQIGERLGFSQGNIKYWMSKYGIKTKASQKKPLTCKLCGETDPDAFYVHKDGRTRYRCRKCDNQEAIKRFRRYKQEAVDYKGGCCQNCGYDKCLASLDFHHLNPDQKDPNWSKMRNWPLDKIKKELDKCLLVCRNCHGEIHYNQEGPLA